MAGLDAKYRIVLQQPSYRRFRAVLKERTRPVILWCGAGLSKPAGLPDWNELRKRLLSDLENKAFTFLDDERSHLLGRVAAIEDEPNAWLAFTLLKKAHWAKRHSETGFASTWLSRVVQIFHSNTKDSGQQGSAEWST